MKTLTKAAIIHVYGRVQGVGFRFFTERKAKELNIKGFVKNRPDGSVYIEAEGEPQQLALFIEWCKSGPSWARVQDVVVADVPPLSRLSFEIR